VCTFLAEADGRTEFVGYRCEFAAEERANEIATRLHEVVGGLAIGEQFFQVSEHVRVEATGGQVLQQVRRSIWFRHTNRHGAQNRSEAALERRAGLLFGEAE
jgi:hypothetical protein